MLTVTSLLVWLSSFLVSAQQVRVRETAGLARLQEPVVVQIWGQPRTLYVTIGANQTRVFPVASLGPSDSVRVVRQPGQVGLLVENSVFVADLTPRSLPDGLEDSGMLRALTFKLAGVTLRRTQNRMHWAPSFQRAGARSYTSMATWTPVQLHHLDAFPESVTLQLQGFHRDYPEIRLRAQYQFFAHVPYFLFESELQIVNPIEMFWLRNQEMTMDDFFTHCAWPRAGGGVQAVTFEQRKPLLEKEPLAVDLPWIAFYHADRGYGYGAVVLSYTASQTAQPKTSINDGANNGKYWDRHLISQVKTPLKAGDRYTEKTAYVLFRTRRGSPLGEFLDWERRLRNPLQVEVLP
ncbi:MAG: hypothetical protein NZV14_01465 [Bryobacteraceae bacterium]|nr:hypothetical protein [Bryobacteraceae bacterium]MDW8376798.1 hypothetical protein [Bryobacterales bacterium]